MFLGSINKDGVTFLPATQNKRTAKKATAINRLYLHPKYFTPELSNAPVTFETELPAFFEMAYRLSPVENRNHQITGFIPQRRPSLPLSTSYPKPKELQTGSHMPNIRGRYFNRDAKFSLTAHQAVVNLFVLMDYEVLRPVPSFLTDWIKLFTIAYPELRVSSLTASHRAFIDQGMTSYPELAHIPHIVIPLQTYKMFEWDDPLSYIVTDRDLQIAFMECAFDVHGPEPIEKRLSSLFGENDIKHD